MKLYRVIELSNGLFYPEQSEDHGTTWNKPPGMPVRTTLEAAKHWCKLDETEQETKNKRIIHNYP